MDDLSINVPVIHETTKQDGVNSRRFSTGKIFLSTTGDQVPHYLQASTGSCHDFCKYGKKNELEVKTRCPLKSRPRRLSTISPQSQSSVESAVFPKRKSMSVIELKQSPDLKTLLPDAKQKLSTKSIDSQSSVESEVLAETKKTSLAKLKLSSCPKPHVYAVPKTMKQEASSSPDKLEVSSKKGPTKLKVKNLPAKHVTPLKSKSLAVKELSSPVTLRGSTSPRKTDLKISQRTGTSMKPKTSSLEQMSSPKSLGAVKGQRTSDIKIGKSAGKSIAAAKKVVVPPAASLSPKPSLKRVASLKSQKNRPMKVLSPLKNQNKISKTKPKQVSDDIQNKIRKAKPKEVSNVIQNKIRKAKTKEPNDDSQNKIRKAKLKELSVINNDEVQEKTLYVIKVETENNRPLESDQNKNCEVELSPPSSSSSLESLSLLSHEGVDQESEYTMSDTEDDSFLEDGEDDHIENAETLDENDGRKARNSRMVGSKDKDGKPLKFRRGKVVDMQIEVNSARRLKFRRGTVLGDNQNVKSDGHRRSFKKRGVRTIGTLPGAEKVVLRHQDVQGKKDGKGLFNNVIEETASKLVETRKSKVKALVGAFETVISLQERKSYAA